MTKPLTPMILERAHWVEAALREGATPDGPYELGRRKFGTPLIDASTAGSLEVIRLLHAAGAKLDRQDKRGGRTALQAAIASHKWEAAALLLELGADVSIGNLPPREWAMLEREQPLAATIRARSPFGGKQHARTIAPLDLEGLFPPTPYPRADAAAHEQVQLELLRLGATFEDVLPGTRRLCVDGNHATFAEVREIFPMMFAHLLGSATWTKGRRFKVKPKSNTGSWLRDEVEIAETLSVETKPDHDRFPSALQLPIVEIGRSGHHTLVLRDRLVTGYDHEEPTDNIVFNLGGLDRFLKALVLP